MAAALLGMCALRWVKEITAPRYEWSICGANLLALFCPRAIPFIVSCRFCNSGEPNSFRSLIRKAADLRAATVSIEWMPASRSDVMTEGYGTGTMDSRSNELAVQRRKDPLTI